MFEMFTPTKAMQASKRLFKSLFSQSTLRNFESTDAASKQIYSPLFFDNKVQHLLKKMSNIKLESVFKPKQTGEEYVTLKYKLMTTEELNSLRQEYKNKANYLLQIPPLIDINEPKSEIIDADTSLDGYDEHHSKHIFVDTSSDFNNEERTIVVREANGVLRTASHHERIRVNQIYCPLLGREINVPKMFSEENIKSILEREDYLFILDRACIQFEPYDKLYHLTIELTYEAINERSHFERLHSTRHMGSLIFYLVTHKKIDKLLIDNIKNDRMNNAYDLICLYHIIHPGCKSAELSQRKNAHEILKDYIEYDSKEKDVLSLTLSAWENREKGSENLDSELKSVHEL